MPLYSGALHYFRLKPSAWRRALEALQSLGLNMVETYVPWGVHELRDGSYDFGQYDPQKDLGAFLDLVHSLGLYAFLRPGPNINAELTYFGLPRRVVFDEACQARSPRGRALPFIAPPRMFPVPSFASDAFFHETERWYTEAAKVIAPRVWPDGPVVLMQVDNEASFFFRDAPYDQDHHPDVLRKYTGFLRERYGELTSVNARYATDFDSWEQALPPSGCEPTAEAPQLRRCLDLMAFQEQLLADTLERLRAALNALVGELPTVHNVPLGEAGLPTTMARIDRVVDINGLDYYHQQDGLLTVKERTLRLAGSVRFAYAPELGIGAPPWFAARSDADSLQTLLTACAYGLRGLNLYMAIDRDRWYGAPFDELGRERPNAEALRRVLRALQHAQFHALTRRVEVAILLPKEYAQLSRATHTLGALSPSLLAIAGAGSNAACLNSSFGFAEPIQIEWTRFVARLAAGLTHLGIPYVYMESDADPAQLTGLRVLISPTYEFADPDRIGLLHDFERGGGRVLCGPLRPELDCAFHPYSETVQAQAASLELCAETDINVTLAELVELLRLRTACVATPSSVQTALHEDASGPRVLFVMQPEGAPVEAEIQVPMPMALVDVLTEDRYEGTSSVSMPVAARTCRMFRCERLPRVGPRTRPPSARRSAAPC